MAKVPMKRLFLCGTKQDRKQILSLLQRAGTVEIDTSRIDDKDLKKPDVMQQMQTFERAAQTIEQALLVLNRYAPDPDAGLLHSLEDAQTVDASDYERRASASGDALKTAEAIFELERGIAEAKAELPKTESRIAALAPWMQFDLPLSFSGTKRTAALIGSFPEEVTEAQLEAALSEQAKQEAKPQAEQEAKRQAKQETEQQIGQETEQQAKSEAKRQAVQPQPIDAQIQIISSSKEMTCVFAVCLRENATQMEEAFKRLNFQRAPLSDLVPAAEAKALEANIRTLNALIRERADEISAYAKERAALRFAADDDRIQAERCRVLHMLPQSKQTFFLEGYVPAASADALAARLQASFDIAVQLSDPSKEEDVPVALSNGFFASPVESVVESYSMPGRAEPDPSRLVSLFYYLMFGMMLSDAGYGLMLVLGTGILLLKVKNMKPAMRSMMKLFFYCGISTVFWGLMFGSFFGDAVNVIATTFFHRPDITLKPLWFEPVKEPMRLLVFAFALGIVHLFTGLGVKGAECIRDKRYLDAVYDVLFWYFFVGGGIVYLLTMPMITGMMNLSFTLSASVARVAAALAAIGGIGIVLTGGRESRNWFKRLLKGAYSAYGVTGYLSDILSYSRLLALGLATGVIAQVFNKMGSMLGATWYGALVFVLVFLIGHVLNLGINVLGSYVHTNRLQFVEFFGKFYEGGGRKYEPFGEHTKYYRVKEDNK